MNNYVDYKQEIKVAVDSVCIATVNNENFVLMIKRVYPPFKDSWALPGGFLLNTEELEEGVLRELNEETNLDTSDLNPIKIDVFGKVGRDPRRRIISVAYLIKLKELKDISLSNETTEVKWVPLKEIENYPLAFDHKEILQKALEIL